MANLSRSNAVFYPCGQGFGAWPSGARSAWLSTSVMAGLVPAIHVLLKCRKGVDARHEAGHDRVNFASSAHIVRSGTGSMLA
jgi:hypothetical protein